MAYYERLRWLREQKEETQKEIGNIIGTTANYYGDYEQGKRSIPFERIIKLAIHYDVSIDYIAELSDDKGGLHKKYINEEEREIIEIWNSLSDKNKIIIKANMEALSDRKEKKEEKKSVG